MKKIHKVLFKNLDDIYKSSKKVSKKFGIRYVSIKYLEELVKITKSHMVDEKKKEAYAIQQGFFNLLDAILKECKKEAKEIGSRGVSFDYLKNCISTVKKYYIEGVQEAA